MAREYPKNMYHAKLPPVIVNSREEQAKLGPEWYTTYIRQEYPRALYHEGGDSRIVKSEEEENALMLTPGWSRKAFPAKPAPVDRSASGTVAVTASLDPDTFQKLQDLEFDLQRAHSLIDTQADGLKALHSLVDSLNGTVAELKVESTSNKILVDSLVTMLAKATGTSKRKIMNEALTDAE